MKFPGSVLVSLVLFLSETLAALCLSAGYRAAGDRMWQTLTLFFALMPCALVQLSLVFIHRDVSRDRPLVLLLHLLQLGPLVRSFSINLQQFVKQNSYLRYCPGCDPQDAGMPEALQRLGWSKVTAGFWASWGIPAAFQLVISPVPLLFLACYYFPNKGDYFPLCFGSCLMPKPTLDTFLPRCVEAFYIYFHAGRVEEPYVSITKKRQMPKDGYSEEIEKEVGQAEGKLRTHRSAFSRASVIQAFLGSAPQLTLQLYICVLQQEITVARSIFMVLSLLSIVYGALRCNILSIKIKYDDYDVRVKPAAYLCIFMWRSFEIATRVTVLVLFGSVLRIWIFLVVLLNFLGFCLYPWIIFWLSKSPFPENIEKELSRVGTTIVLCLLTFLYAGINMFCWSAAQVELSDPDLISKSQNWYQMTVYYIVRLMENAFLLLMWFIYKTDFYLYVCAPMLVLQLLIGYCMGIFFMLVFYQFCHPCKKLFSSSITEALLSCFKILYFICQHQKSTLLTGKVAVKSPQNTDEARGSSKTIDSRNGSIHQSVSSNA